MDSIRETFNKKNINPAEKLIEMFSEIEEDEAVLKDAIADDPDLKKMSSTILDKTRSLKHKILKDLVVAKQTEDEQLIKLQQLKQAKNVSEGAKIPVIGQHQKKQLPDGRWVIDFAKKEEV
jgi:hypothetical protein